MSTISALPPLEVYPFDELVPPPTNLPEEDGVNLESDWHRLEMTLLIELVGLHLEGRDDYFVGGNMFIYFDTNLLRDRNFRGPDFFFVKEAKLNPPRPYWAIWNEGGKYPDVIIELSSPSTRKEDFGVKKTTYQNVFRTHEYFIFDPVEKKLYGWRLTGNDRVYQEIPPNEQGWLWSSQLGLWLGVWAGKYQGKDDIYLRYYDNDGNLVLTSQERVKIERRRTETEMQRVDIEKQNAEAERLRAEIEKQNAEAERLRAEIEKQNAEAERLRAEIEKRRADQAEAELAQLRAAQKKSGS